MSFSLSCNLGNFASTTVVIAANDDLGREFLRQMTGSKVAPVSVEIYKSAFGDVVRKANQANVSIG